MLMAHLAGQLGRHNSLTKYPEQDIKLLNTNVRPNPYNINNPLKKRKTK
jgi:hypothetical protein